MAREREVQDHNSVGYLLQTEDNTSKLLTDVDSGGEAHDLLHCGRCGAPEIQI